MVGAEACPRLPPGSEPPEQRATRPRSCCSRPACAAIEADALSVAQVAAQLGVSARTLQRRLAAEQVSFQELLDVYRQERAMELLREGRLIVGEVAYALGYAEQSAFTRTFRRWTGLAPRAWAAGQGQQQ